MLTRAAFGAGTALNYAELSGIPKRLICEIMARPIAQVRSYTTLLEPDADRRAVAREAPDLGPELGPDLEPGPA
ncbi:hypothetical protein ASC94_07115 [Massilia sp. Root418]|nr:hypothetical protein ASC94_07115 [Massilia sp. Root418]